MTIAAVALPSSAEARNRSKPAKAKTNPGDWFPISSYPADAKRAGLQGRVTVELKIDKTGAPTACTVTGSSGTPSLDKVTCDLAMANGKFTPALDAKGQPTEATYALPGVRWVLQDEPPTKLEGPWRTAATLQIDQAGKLASCSEKRSGPVPAQVQLCLVAQKMPPAFGLFARGGSTAPLGELIMESSVGFDGTPALPMAYESSGRDILKMGVIHFDVGIDGKVGNCQVQAQSGPNPDDLCKDKPGPFLPIDKSRGMTVSFAMSRSTVAVAPAKP